MDEDQEDEEEMKLIKGERKKSVTEHEKEKKTQKRRAIRGKLQKTQQPELYIFFLHHYNGNTGHNLWSNNFLST